jgi:hypothetical protein
MVVFFFSPQLCDIKNLEFLSKFLAKLKLLFFKKFKKLTETFPVFWSKKTTKFVPKKTLIGENSSALV